MPRARNNHINKIYDPTELYGSNDRIFRLRLDSMGRIQLELVNDQGNNRSAGHILAIEPSGHLYRYMGVNTRAGLPRDANGIVKTVNEEHQETLARRNS